jgi:hypothetical protein
MVPTIYIAFQSSPIAQGCYSYAAYIILEFEAHFTFLSLAKQKLGRVRNYYPVARSHDSCNFDMWSSILRGRRLSGSVVLPLSSSHLGPCRDLNTLRACRCDTYFEVS